MGFINDFVGWANDILWGPVMIYGILVVGLLFSILTKFAQVRLIKDMFVLLFGAGTDYCLFLITRYRDILLTEENKFQALAVAVRESSGVYCLFSWLYGFC